MSDGPREADAIRDQALIHWERREHGRAVELLVEQERICRERDDPGGAAVSIADQGLIMRDRGDESGAQIKLREAIEVARAAALQSRRAAPLRALADRIELRLNPEKGDSPGFWHRSTETG